MKKTFSRFALAVAYAAFLVGVPAIASAAAPNWDVSGSYVWGVMDTYYHDLTLTMNPDGTFAGTGSYPASGYPLVGGTGPTGELVLNGVVSGDNISFTVTYTGPYAPGSTFNMTGAIVPDGTISGTSPWSWTMATGKAQSYDADHDGVMASKDYCPGTTADGSWDVSFGPNRWQVQDVGGTLQWFQNKVKKGVPTPTMMYPDLTYTYGCNGHQILDLLKASFGSMMNGHYKYGLSSSVLEDFHKDMADGVLDGYYYLETLSVPANSGSPVSSTAALISGHEYKLKASGTAMACNEPGCVIVFDPEYSTSDSGTTWVDGVAPPYDSYGPNLLDLMVDGGYVNWGAYNPAHTYEIPYVGTGAPASFGVYDVFYPNNTGALSVDIFGKI